MDEAASKLRMEINSKPEELDVLDRKIMQLEIEIEAIKREKDESKLKILNIDLSELKEQRNEIYAKWKSEKDVVDAIFSTDDRATAEAIIDGFDKFWQAIPGTRGATGKKTVNASTNYFKFFRHF